MSLKPYIQIARPDHWFKNVFMIPGTLLVFFFHRDGGGDFSWGRLLLAFAAVCLVASSYYVLNEILDAEKDRHHPTKKNRPIPSGQVRLPLAWAEWLLLAAAGLGLSFMVNLHFGITALVLWLMGAAYNIPPVRTKDLAYADVLSESLNNPLRLMLGWYATGYLVLPPMSVVLAYWMFGAFLMAMKRYAEYREIRNPEQAAQYRKSFGTYTEERLIESIFFYGSLFGMLSGVFMARYQVELVLATPLVALAMAYYMHLGFKPDSPVQRPEELYREKKLMVLVTLAAGACALLLMVDIPGFTSRVEPTSPPPGVAAGPLPPR